MSTNQRLLAALALAIFLASPSTALTILYADSFAPEAVGATGTGDILLTLDTDLNTLRVEGNYAGMSGTLNNAHIHCCTATPGTGTVGIAVGTPFTLGASAGSFDLTFDLALTATFNASFLAANGGTAAGAAGALIAALNAGTAYLNLHSTTFPGGEIRGFPTLVPEPATALTLLLGLVLLSRAGRHRTR